ncbi:methyl-accepting chemotaxis protein [Photobacterium sp. J15]|uniref:methyl-accepting chemotaxis protein n=1 Tax=Photobacterium sp. J15 TaxID=265901 RepID=UPI0007E4B8CD|nr:methyl-accepting chemotaxis protein [Photobacterium sp. J15]
MSFNWGLRGKLLACFSCLALFIITSYSTYSYNEIYKTAIKGLDSKLISSAYALNMIIGESTHNVLPERATNYDQISRRISSYVEKSNIDWAYSTVQKNGKIYYTYINQTEDELRTGSYQNWYLEEYKVVPKGLTKAFITRQVQFEEYQGEYGLWRSVFVPFRNANGEYYVIGVDVALSDIEALQDEVVVHVIGFAAVLLTITLLVTYYIAVKTVKPINYLNLVLKEFADGDWNLTRNLKVTNTDEVGIITRSFNVFISSLRSRIHDINDGSQSIKEVTANLDSIFDGISKRSVDQAENVRSSATAIEELAASIQSVSMIANDINDQVKRFEQQTQETVTTVDQAVSGMEDVQTGVINLASNLEHLDKSTNEINSIVSVIKEIADQTNLLALNAAIEAARAGQHGRGFAVVADEVRKLSERTSVATVEIETMLDNIRTDTNKTTSNMQSSVELVNESTSHANSARGSLVTFSEEIIALLNSMEQISESMKEQSEAAQHLSGNVSLLSMSADENHLATRNSEVELEELKKRSVNLHTVVEQFKI